MYGVKFKLNIDCDESNWTILIEFDHTKFGTQDIVKVMLRPNKKGQRSH